MELQLGPGQRPASGDLFLTHAAKLDMRSLLCSFESCPLSSILPRHYWPGAILLPGHSWLCQGKGGMAAWFPVCGVPC
eukprot:1153796-Pelagomonas_calceolata.AAC.3